jgi:rod shape-determining protein MreB
MVAVGQEARDMYGRVPESIEVARPLKNGVIADYEITETLLSYLLQRVSGSMRIFRPRVMISVPYGVTSVERRAVYEAVLEAGSREAYLIQQPLAAALGVDLPIGSPSGNMAICLGGGCTEAAVMAMYGIVSAETLRAGGMDLDEAIVNYIRRKYGIVIGQVTAEQLKTKIGAAVPQDTENSMEVQGQDQVTGLPPGVNHNRRDRGGLAGTTQSGDRDGPPRPRADPSRAGRRYHRPGCGVVRGRRAAAWHR